MKSKGRELFMYVLGAIVVIATFTLIGMLVFVVLKHPETPLRDTLTLAIGSLLAAFGLVVGYFYGSSKGSADKSEAINETMKES